MFQVERERESLDDPYRIFVCRSPEQLNNLMYVLCVSRLPSQYLIRLSAFSPPDPRALPCIDNEIDREKKLAVF